ncbi:MAG: DEAD/DEAH box helicase [Bdellovibrionales bacterium]|nr:DEAD/DEAH box helicase [Bdellovibrionales bacterium]
MSITLFSELKLPANVDRAIQALGFVKPTPIQAAAIPVGLSRKDLVGVAQTGTGKTCAFSIPILVTLSQMPGKTALVLAPTRELALQIEEFWRGLTKFSPGMHSVILIGGVGMNPQIKGLQRKPRLVVATPGRLCDHIQRRTIDLRTTEILVLDEADRMLDMGFAPQLNQIVRHLPTARQTLFFTATWAKEMDELAKKYLRNPERVTVGQVSSAAPKVDQAIIKCSVPEKNEALLDELNAREGSVLVFARTQSRTDRVAKYLGSYGMEVGRIHGGRSQAQRVAALGAFKKGAIRVLVATDIAARGIDVTDIGHVINYDLPQVPEDYIHRIGRTGRAGATGKAVSFVTPEDRKQWEEIYRLLKRGGTQVAVQPMTSTPDTRPERVAPAPRPADHGQPHGGRRDRGHGRPNGGGGNGGRGFARRGGGRRDDRGQGGGNRQSERASGGGVVILNDPFRVRS